jgi:hypothetical protein
MHYKSGLKICFTSGGFNLCFAFFKKKLLIQYNLKKFNFFNDQILDWCDIKFI